MLNFVLSQKLNDSNQIKYYHIQQGFHGHVCCFHNNVHDNNPLGLYHFISPLGAC